MDRTAVSRPEPGPLTCTSTRRRPCSIAARAALSAAIWAANGVLLREPLKPTPPEEAHEMTVFEDFVTERVRAGQSITGLYPPTDPANLKSFAVWREKLGR